MSKYILQKDNYSCSCITIMNACIHRYGHDPFDFKYNSKKYHEYVSPFMRSKYRKKELNRFAATLGVKRVKPNRNKIISFESTKQYIIELLNDDCLIDLSVWMDSPHSCLLCDYNKDFDTFKIVNAQFFTDSDPVEWLPLEILFNCKNSRKFVGYRHTNGSYSHAKRSCDINFLQDFMILKF